MSKANPDIVEQLLKQAESARKELGEFMQRGKSQRPTGSIYPDCPVISHEKDWGLVPAEIRNALEAEQMKRHPTGKPLKKERKTRHPAGKAKHR